MRRVIDNDNNSNNRGGGGGGDGGSCVDRNRSFRAVKQPPLQSTILVVLR